MNARQIRIAVALATTLFGASCGIPQSPRTWEEPAPNIFTTGPYLILGGPGTAYVVLKASLDEPPTVVWWNADLASDGAQGTRVRAIRTDDIWVATLNDLPEGPSIGYQVVSSAGTTEPHSFKIGAKPGVPFRFAAYGDTRTRHGVHRAVVEALDRENIDFVLHTGDMVERGGIQAQWDLFFQIERPLLVDVPIVPSIGNHDIGARQYYRRYFLHRFWARNLRYYAKDWGNLRMVALDGGIECRDGCAQYTYAERALQDAAKKDMFVVIFLHFPPYSSGKHGSNKTVQKPIVELAKRHGVELVISGHDHNYERSKELDGTTYVVSGSAGAPSEPVHPRWFTAHARTEPHYVLIDVEEEQMTLRAINLKGETFDTKVLRKLPPARELLEREVQSVAPSSASKPAPGASESSESSE